MVAEPVKLTRRYKLFTQPEGARLRAERTGAEHPAERAAQRDGQDKNKYTVFDGCQ